MNDSQGERIAKIIARSGYCSRREAEELIRSGLVKVNGEVMLNPATIITDQAIKINNKLLARKEPTKMWIFHKPKGFITTNKDPEGRKTIFDILPKNLPRVITIGRLDINTEGLMLLTNDGEIARYIELPKNGWTRNYRVRVFGKINQERLNLLKRGIKIEGVFYKAANIEIEREREFNSWLKISLQEGKNQEVKKLMEYVGLQVNRLIRTSFGPFHLGKLPIGAVQEISKNTLQESLGKHLNQV